MAAETETKAGPLQIASTVVGLFAGIATLVYLLGGLVIALRMIYDHYDQGSIVSAVGQLPRELVMTTALLEVLGPSLVLGLAAALVYGALDRPRPRRWKNDNLDEGRHWPWLFVLFLVIAAGFAAFPLLHAWRTDHLSILLLPGLLVFGLTFGLLAAGWYTIRRIGRLRWSRFVRAFCAGAIWAGLLALPITVLASGQSFPEAQVCVSDSQLPQVGWLIGEGGGHLLLEQKFGHEASVLSIPSERVTKTEYGDLSSTFACAAPGATAEAPKLEGHGSKEEVRLATRLRPRLRFDGKERWRPLEVESFLAERFKGGARHGACAAGKNPPCPPVAGVQELNRKPGAPAYIDIYGRARNGADFESPDEACLRSPPAVDCNSGRRSVVYYRRTSHEGRWYWDYWWFYRYNDYEGRVNHCVVICGDHEGDWEGVTVVSTASLEPEILGVIYAAHKDRIWVDGATLPTAAGHPLVWVARGTHASYPYDCAEDCEQYNGFPEGTHDGAVPWGGNREDECERVACVRALPEVGHPSELALPLAGGWAGWPGRWGETCHDGCHGIRHQESSPASPGDQPRFRCPWVPTRRAQPAADGSGLSDSVETGDHERLYATCLAQRGGR